MATSEVNKILEELAIILDKGIGAGIDHIDLKLDRLNKKLTTYSSEALNKLGPGIIKDINAIHTGLQSIITKFGRVDVKMFDPELLAQYRAQLNTVIDKLFDAEALFANKVPFFDGIDHAIKTLAEYQNKVSKLTALQAEYNQRLNESAQYAGSWQDFMTTRIGEDQLNSLVTSFTKVKEEGETFGDVARRLFKDLNQDIKKFGGSTEEVKAIFERLKDYTAEVSEQVKNFGPGDTNISMPDASNLVPSKVGWTPEDIKNLTLYNELIANYIEKLKELASVNPEFAQQQQGFETLRAAMGKAKEELDAFVTLNPNAASGNLVNFIDEIFESFQDKSTLEILKDLRTKVLDFAKAYGEASNEVKSGNMAEELRLLETKMQSVPIGIGKPEDVAKQQRLASEINTVLKSLNEATSESVKIQELDSKAKTDSMSLYDRLVAKTKAGTLEAQHYAEALRKTQELIVSLSTSEKGSTMSLTGEEQMASGRSASADAILKAQQEEYENLKRIVMLSEQKKEAELKELEGLEETIRLLEQQRQEYVKIEATRRGLTHGENDLSAVSGMLAVEHRSSKSPHAYISDEQIVNIAKGEAYVIDLSEAIKLVNGNLDRMSTSTKKANSHVTHFVDDLKEQKKAHDQINRMKYESLDDLIKTLEAGGGTVDDWKQALKELQSAFDQTDVWETDLLKDYGEQMIKVKDKLQEFKDLQTKGALKEGGVVVDFESMNAYDEAMQKSKQELIEHNIELEKSIAFKKASKVSSDENKEAIAQEQQQIIINKLALKEKNNEEKAAAKAEKEAREEAKKTKFEHEELRAAISRLAKEVRKGSISYNEAQEQLAKFKRTVDEMPMSVQKGLERPLRKATGAIAKYKDAQSTSLGGLDKVMSTITTRFGYFLTSGVMVMKAIQAIGKAIKAVVKYSLEFEKSLANLRAVVRPTTIEFTQMEYAIRKASLGSTQSLQQVGDAATAIAKLGFTAVEITSMIEPITMFTQATRESTDAVANLLGSTIRAFQLDFRDSKEVMDVFAQAINRSAISFSYLQTSMKIVGPVAKSINLPLKDTLGYLGALANAGLDASRGATALRNIMLHLSKENGKLSKTLGYVVKDAETFKRALKDLSKMNIDLASSLELTDKRSVAAFNRLLVANTEVEELINHLNNASGALEKMREEQLSSTITSWDALNVSVKNFFSYIIGGTPQVAGFFKKIRDSLDETTLAMMMYQGSEMGSKEFGLTGIMPKYQKEWRTKGLSEGKIKEKMVVDEKLKSITWQAYINDYVEENTNAIRDLRKAFETADKKTYKEAFKKIKGIDIEEYLKDDEAHKLNVEKGLTSNWQVIADDAIFKMGNDNLKALRKSFDLDASAIANDLRGLMTKEGMTIFDTNVYKNEVGDWMADALVAQIRQLSRPSMEAMLQKIRQSDEFKERSKTEEWVTPKQILGERIARMSASSLITKDISSAMGAQAKEGDPYKDAKERWAKFMQQVNSDRLKAEAALSIDILKNQSKFYEKVSKNAKQSSEVRMEASKNWFNTEADLLAAQQVVDETNHKEQIKKQWAQAKNITELKESELKAFEAWYAEHYSKEIERIDRKYALEYEVLYQKVLQTRMNMEQTAQRKRTEIYKQELDEQLKIINVLNKKQKEAASHTVAKTKHDSTEGLGFFWFKETEFARLDYELQLGNLNKDKASLNDKLIAQTNTLNLLTSDLDKLQQNQIYTTEEYNKVMDSLSDAFEKGYIDGVSYNTMLDTLADVNKDGAMSTEEYKKILEEFRKNVNLTKEELEALDVLIKNLGDLKPKFFGDWGQEMSAGSKKFLEDWKKSSAVVTNMVESLADVFTSFYDNKLSNLEYYYQKEEELINKNYQKEMDSLDERRKQIQDNKSLGLLSAAEADAQTRLLDAQKEQREKKYAEEKEKREEDYQKKKNELEVKSAKWQKAVAIMNATNAMAVGIINAMALQPLPLALAAAAVVTGIGAAQIAAIATQPLPRYAKGIGFHPGGPAIVGDGGKHEVIVSPRTSTVMDLPRGTQVFPDVEAFLLSRLAGAQSFNSHSSSTILSDPELRALTALGNVELTKIGRTLMTMRANDRFLIQESIRQSVISKYR